MCIYVHIHTFCERVCAMQVQCVHVFTYMYAYMNIFICIRARIYVYVHLWLDVCSDAVVTASVAVCCSSVLQ